MYLSLSEFRVVIVALVQAHVYLIQALVALVQAHVYLIQALVALIFHRIRSMVERVAREC